jgi:uncharacterized protein (DUF433 family)
VAESTRIYADPAICSGKPIIRGTRIMVRNVLSLLKSGYDVDRIVSAYPELSVEDVQAAIDYAAELVDAAKLVPRAS